MRILQPMTDCVSRKPLSSYFWYAITILLKYVAPKLVNVSDIALDNNYLEQIARANVNPKGPDLRDDIRFNGFNLAELGVFLVRLKNGKFLIMSRTRTKYFIEDFGMTNAIADVFDVEEIADDLFCIFMNSSKKPSVNHLMKIFVRELCSSLKLVQLQPDTSVGRDPYYAIKDGSDFMSGGSSNPAQYDLIILAAIEKPLGYKSVISFPFR